MLYSSPYMLKLLTNTYLHLENEQNVTWDTQTCFIWLYKIMFDSIVG